MAAVIPKIKILQLLRENSTDIEEVTEYWHPYTRFASADVAGTIIIWKVFNTEDPNNPIVAIDHRLLGHQSRVLSLCFDSSYILASCSSDLSIKIWDTASGVLLNTIWGHTDTVRSVDFNEMGTRLVSTSDDMTVRVWNTSSFAAGDCPQVCTLLGHTQYVFTAKFHPNGRTIVSGGGDGRIIFWSCSEAEDWGLEAEMIPGLHSDDVLAISFHRNGELVACSTVCGIIYFIDVIRKEIRNTWRDQEYSRREIKSLHLIGESIAFATNTILKLANWRLEERNLIAFEYDAYIANIAFTKASDTERCAERRMYVACSTEYKSSMVLIDFERQKPLKVFGDQMHKGSVISTICFDRCGYEMMSDTLLK